MKLEANPYTGKNKITLHNVFATKLNRGIEHKNILDAKITLGARSKPVSLIERSFPEQQDKNKWLKNWQMLHDAGLPIPPTVRISNRGTLLVTNLRQNGEEMYGKGILNHLCSLKESRQEYHLRKIDNVFFHIMETQSKTIVKEVNRLTNIANRHFITFPIDDPCELLVRPDGSWQLIIADLLHANQRNSKSIVIAENYQLSMIFLHFLNQSYQRLTNNVGKQTAISKLINNLKGDTIIPPWLIRA